MHQIDLQLQRLKIELGLLCTYIFVNPIGLTYIRNGYHPLYWCQTSLQSSIPLSKHHCER